MPIEVMTKAVVAQKENAAIPNLRITAVPLTKLIQLNEFSRG